MRTAASLLAWGFACCSGLASAQTPPPITVGPVTVSGSVRTRVEAWNWFDGAADDQYVYSGTIGRVALRQARPRVDWQVEFAIPILLGLPAAAIAPGPQGQFGLGAAYFAANDNVRNAAHLFVKQGFVRFKDLGGRPGQSLAVGRLEFVDGAEVAPADRTLAALKRDRLAHRLLGSFAFSHVGRSFDGVHYSSGGSRINVTGLAARPTWGVFQVNGWGDLDVNVFYGAVTGQVPHASRPAEWRAFALGYRDYRSAAIKTDARPLPDRRGDTSDINLVTIGGHYVAAATTRYGTLDVLVWGAAQRGSWGSLSHRAAAVAAEAGWQPGASARRPWIRGGWNYGSGDGNPADRTHGTFFQVLPTPRIYARFPFFNMMNVSDGFGELVIRPGARLTARFDAHALRLASVDDLWYQGGGAFEPATFGFAGRPSNGSTNLATLLDAGAEYAVSPRIALGAYYAVARGGAVVTGTYASRHAQFGYAELTVRF